MKNKHEFWINLLIALWQGAIYGFLALILTAGCKLPIVVVIAALMGIQQIQSAGDVTKIQNDIFELKEILEDISAKNKTPDING